MPIPPIEQQLFRRVCSKFATGITVLTLCDAGGAPHGMTANSFTSVSLDPPMILVCIDRKARMLPHFAPGVCFAVNVLEESQQDLSNCFARNVDRFQSVEWSPGETGSPVLSGALAAMECTAAQLVDAGDHVVVLGEVSHAAWSEGQPLIYFNSGYQTLRSEG